MANKAQGTLLQIGDGGSPEVFTTVAELRSFTGPGAPAAKIDTTTLSSTAKEFVLGLKDNGEISFEAFLKESDPGQAALFAARDALVARNFKLIMPFSPARTWAFLAFVMEFNISGGVDDVINAQITLAITGDITRT